MKKYEYYETETFSLEEANILGGQGWELVICYEYRNNCIKCVFKRPLIDKTPVDAD
jgi:hypothetical protein